MRWVSILLGIAVAVGGLMVFMSSQDALTELDKGIQSASDIPLIGWITGSLAEASSSETRKELQLYRMFGIGVMAAGGLILLVGLMTGKGKQ